MNFCDFCECEACKTGDSLGLKLVHAPTKDNKWICEICFSYDVCTSGPNRSPNPCENYDCEHRPKLAGPWRAKGVK